MGSFADVNGRLPGVYSISQNAVCRNSRSFFCLPARNAIIRTCDPENNSRDEKRGKGCVCSLKASIDRDGCISCGLCPTICPEVFRMADDGLAEVYVDEIPESEEGSAVEAQDSWPVGVISVG
jgi:ferredoxin